MVKLDPTNTSNNHVEKEITTLPESTTIDRMRFSSGIAAYRIIRLSVELFLILHIQNLNYPVKLAGLIFLLYSIASIATGFLFLLYPTISFGSYKKAMGFFVVSVGFMIGGFILVFICDSFGSITLFAMACGSASSAFNINYQALTNITFPKEQLGSVALLRQLFECLGFLLPSICLAIINSVQNNKMMDGGNSEDDINNGKLSSVSDCVIVLGIIAFVFALMSMDRIVYSASKVSPQDIMRQQEDPQQDVEQAPPKTSNTMMRLAAIKAALKEFFATSVIKYFLMNSILLSISNLIMADMSLITEHYFGMDPTYLWVGAIGFPIGGIASVGWRTIKSSSDNEAIKHNSKTNLLVGSFQLACLFTLCILFTPLVTPAQAKTAKTLLFFFGFATGNIYSTTYASSLELWLLKLKEYPVNFVSRAAVINNLGVQAIIAIIFLIQTVLVDTFVTNTTGKDDKNNSNSNNSNEDFVPNSEEEMDTSWGSSIVFFGPLLVLLAVAWMICRSVPYPHDDEKFGWTAANVVSPYKFHQKLILRLINNIPGITFAGTLAFSMFSMFRVSLFMEHIDDDCRVKGGYTTMNTGKEGTSTTLSPASLECHLRDFDRLALQESWWRSPNTKLCSILLDNEKSLEQRLELIAKAKHSIWTMTWVFEESDAGNKIADALIQRAEDGLDVRVVVDLVTLSYLYEKKQLIGTNEMDILKKLSLGGVAVRMLGTWHMQEEKNKPSYVIGTHRKIVIVDHSYMLTGGRNVNDKYFTTHDFHYSDVEVLLQGNFKGTTCEHYKLLWEQSKPTTLQQLQCETVRSLSIDALDESLGIIQPESLLRLDNVDDLEIGSKAISSQNSRKGWDNDRRVSFVEEKSSDEDTPMCTTDELFSSDGQAEETPSSKGDDDIDIPGHNNKKRRQRRSSINLVGRSVSLFELDHAAGNPDGYDIILSALIFLIDSAEESIDLTFGYLQLFEPLEDAITRAVKERGVKIRIVTNSEETNGLGFLNRIFGTAIERLLGLDNVELYVPCSRAAEKIFEDHNIGHFTLHYKMAVFDGRCAMVGSWNCLGTSVFFDADFSVVMFDDNKSDVGDGIFHPLQDLITDSVQSGLLVRVQSKELHGFQIPLYAKLLSDKYGKMQMNRGF